MKFGSTFVLYL